MYHIVTGRKERLKNRQDPRYLAIHKRYLQAVGKSICRGKMSRMKIKELSDSARVWKSTFYDHFLHMDDAIDQFWHAKDAELTKLRRSLGNVNIEKIISRILFFIYRNRDYYYVAVKKENPLPLKRIVEIFRDNIAQSWSCYEKDVMQRCMMIFEWEFAAAICYWGKYEKFNFDMIPKKARELARLCRNATQRLA